MSYKAEVQSIFFMNLVENLGQKKQSSGTYEYTAERGLLEPALGLYGLGSPAMLISEEKKTEESYGMITHLHPSQTLSLQSTAKQTLQLFALVH